jgi:hypothetical protein
MNLRNATGRVATLVCLLGASATLSFSQFESATVLGTIYDPGNAAVSGAAVTLINVKTGVSVKSVTDASGNYLFVNQRRGRRWWGGDWEWERWGFTAETRRNTRKRKAKTERKRRVRVFGCDTVGARAKMTRSYFRAAGDCALTPMSPPAKSKRFRVALPFPGEHRARVARIAEALGDRLGRKLVLYDRWPGG